MKRIALLVVVFTSVLFAACGHGTPDNKVYNTRIDSTHNIHYVPQGAGLKPLRVDDTLLLIQPTFSQAVGYATEAEHWTWHVVQWGLFLAGILLIVLNVRDSAYLPKSLSGNVPIFIVLALWIGSLYPIGEVKWNNTKEIPQATYNKAMKESGSTQPIWDSLYEGGHILGAKYKK